ncbi:60S ribosomal protein L3 [Orbilia oligospora]|uniref:60S ribosomal protein L3 n=1 Tax=Orbilia oligospora TaxID=2813651 RepID=A0A6G1LSC0_ORBOL|nr:60S ribosomal protein L3 [Orbilia oligospora]KAF3229979.1 60S ribosomal protein L3 [Orbilia oligospora]
MDLPPASPEEVLSQAFDRLSHSHSPTSIQIGLDAIDEYLALVCSTPVPICSPVAAKTSTASTTLDPQEKLPYPTSPWIKEFRKLQDGFQYNIALRLVGCIDRILVEKKNSQQDIFLTSCLQCLQGTLLLHPESRNLFAREAHMAVVLSITLIFVQLLTRRQPLDLRVLTIDTLVSALLECPANMRTFEALNGLQTISLLFRNRQTPEKIRLRVTEFLYFYLLPEVEDSQGHQRNRYQMRESGYSSAQVVVIGNERVMGPKTRSIEQKEEMLGKHLKGIEGIVRDIRRVVS